jgi:hypothetical protein
LRRVFASAPYLSPPHYEMLQELTQELLREVAIAGKAPVSIYTHC